MFARAILLTSLAATITALAACVAEPEQAEYPLLNGRFLEEDVALPLIADKAYLSDTDFFVRYKRGDTTYYGGGTWAERLPILKLNEGGGYDGPWIVPLQYEQATRWSQLPDQYVSALVLGIADWHEVRGRLFAALLPRDSKSGVVLHFNIDDYFLYYDEDGDFRASVIDAKPGNYQVLRRIDMAELVNAGLPILEEFLDQRGIDERRIAFSTGDTGYYSLPFLYVNRDLPIAVFVRLPGPGRKFRPGSAPAPYVQTAGHVAGSHTTGIVFRPVSSLYRLLFVATDTVAEAVSPAFLTHARHASVPPLSTGPGMDLDEWESRLDKLTGRQSSKGTIRYLVDGEEFFTRFIDTVTAAESSIALRTYIFDNDD
jgi:hypothetical protein